MQNDLKTSRREFLKNSTAAAVGIGALGAPVIKPVLGANDKIRMGFIGVGNRGTQLLHSFVENKDVDLVALCDVYEPFTLRDPSKLDPIFVEKLGKRLPALGEKFGKYDRYSDFRKLLERKDIDAVCIATPDHWHSIQMIEACEAGKDVYVEKPLTIALKEGRRMVDAAERTGQIVQVGLNRRGSTLYQQMVKLVQGGKLGKITTARASRISNMYPKGIGNEKPADPPKDLDWDMWLGPREYRPFQYNIMPYFFRWWKSYSSQMGNWGVHYFDVMRWMMGERAPVAVTAIGGKYALTDDRTIPDTTEVIFEFASGAIMTFSIYEASGGRVIQKGEVELRGTKGTLYTTDNNYTIVPSKAGQFQDWDELVEETDQDISVPEDITSKLIRNFLDCVKSKAEPWCPLEEGHRSTSFAHIANISLEVGGRLEWDAEKEQFINNDKANELLDYEYRSPWKKA